MKLRIGARPSPLSRAQVEEVLRAWGDPKPDYELHWVHTVGDMDKASTLRTREQTDFFTRELDALLLSGAIDLAIHSAKDLPVPLPTGLALAVLTDGVDPADSLVYAARTPSTELLPSSPLIATSSLRREEAVRRLFPAARFVDLRGWIEERLAVLERGEVDGVVVAEAALIRLGLTHLPRLLLPGETAPLQGKLALICREEKARWIAESFHRMPFTVDRVYTERGSKIGVGAGPKPTFESRSV
jgi:hydroxymethylbilane synthase